MKIVLALLLVCAVFLSACAPVIVPTPSAPGTATPASAGTIRVGFSSNADVGDVPSLMAHELLEAQGYTVERQNFAGADLQAVALTQGDLDFGNGSMRTLWLALDKAPRAMTIMEQVADNWLLVVKAGLDTCDALNGQRIAFTSTGSLSYALFDAYRQQECPDLEYEQILISSSNNRAAALLAGEIDATPLNLVDWMQVQQQVPDRFHVLINFGKELPGLRTTGIHVNRAFAQAHPQAVRDYLAAVLSVHRTIRENPGALEDAMVKYLQLDKESAHTIAQEYLALDMWDVNGGLAIEDVQKTIDFFTRSESLPEGLTPESVADLSYLEAALEQLGRK